MQPGKRGNGPGCYLRRGSEQPRVWEPQNNYRVRRANGLTLPKVKDRRAGRLCANNSQVVPLIVGYDRPLPARTRNPKAD